MPPQKGFKWAKTEEERLRRRREAKARYRAKSSAKEKAAAWLASTREKRLLGCRQRQLARYGLTLVSYDTLLQQQNYRCAICQILANTQPRKLAVDHCHKTGKVRGLLCFRCNASIGKLEDDPELIQKALDYIRRYA